MTVKPPPIPSIQLAWHLGRPIHHEDYHDTMPRQFMAGVFMRIQRRPVPTEVSQEPVKARLDAGRWLADCPMGCRGAEMVSPAEPVFLCCSCGSGDKWWPVVFPRIKKAIEFEVIKRDKVMGWSWFPGEGITTIRAETVKLKGAGLA